MAEDKEEYQRRYHEFKEAGHPFWPDDIFRDLVVALVVLAGILFMATTRGVPLGNLADPTNREFVPRPEWYFMFIFQLIKYFPGYLEWVGVLVVPGIAILLLVLLPFLDRGPGRHPGRRPLAIGAMALTLAASVLLTVRAFQTTPPSLGEEAPLLTSIQQVGRSVYRAQGCSSCHRIAGEGNQQGISLDGAGSRYGPDYFFRYVANPKEINPNSVMPAFQAVLGPRELDALGQYLATLK